MKAFFVSDRLAFGSAIKTRQHVERLRSLGLTHVINLRWSQNNAKVRQFKHVWLRFHDDKKPRPAWFFRDSLRFYRNAIQRSDSKVFVMCRHGICRSASLAYFLLRTDGYSPAKAEAIVLRVRRRAIICRAYRQSGEDFLAVHEIRKNKSKDKRSKS